MRYAIFNTVPDGLRWIAVVSVLGSVLIACASAGASDRSRLRAARAELNRSFGEQLDELAKKCEELGLAREARVTKQWFVPRAPDRQYFFLVPPTDPLVPQETAPKIEKQWYAAFRHLRDQHADKLISLAERFLESAHGSEAFALVHEALRENPDHERARSFLRYHRVNGEWRQVGSYTRVRKSRAPHPKLGWHAGRYWRIETPHFEIVTDHSAAAGEELGERLEELFSVWHQLYFEYWSNVEVLRRRFDAGASIRSVRRSYDVVLFKDRPSYIATLQQAEPQVSMSLGYYLERERQSFFYWGDRAAEPTWFHEGTHQLFQESRRGTDGVGEKCNFWVVEAAALYMESMQKHNGYYTVGGVESTRLQYARNRALAGRFHVPLAELCAMGRDDFQADRRIRMIYSQIAGVGHFLMDGASPGGTQGEYRDAFIAYLKRVYLGRHHAGTLAEICGTDCETLDRRYAEFLKVTDADLAAIPANARITKLSLGHTAVTDGGLKSLPDLANLEWLELTNTRVSDAGISAVATATSLRDLNLERTQITDGALPVIGQFRRLEELDLSGTAVTDAGLKHLGGLADLKIIWLTGTRITDAGMKQLKGLRKLEQIEVTGTQVSHPPGKPSEKQD